MEVKKQLIQDWTWGGDCEWFVQDTTTGKILTAENLVKGTKKDPYHFDPENKYHATSLDCVLAEVNTNVVQSPLEMFLSLEKLRNYINSTLPSGLTTLAIPAARLEEDQLQSETAQIFGCEPSLCCYHDEEVIPHPTGDNLRSAGMHWHYGYNSPTPETNRDLIRALDLFLGVPSILIEPTNERKKVGYGCAGNYRNTKPGVEYRSLSSHFSSGKNLIEWCFRGSERAIAYVNSREVERIYDMGELIQQTINQEDKALAEMICKDFGIELV